MASTYLKDKLFTLAGARITVNNLPIQSFGFDEDETIIFRAVETLDWEREKHLYYEWTISDAQWQEAAVDKNKITVKFNNNTAVEIEVWEDVPINLEEFHE